MKWRATGYLLITVFLLILSGWGGATTALPAGNPLPGELSAIRHKPLPHKDPETIRQTVSGGLYLLMTKKPGHPGWADPDKVTTARIESFTIHGARLPDWLKQYLQHNYPSHNFW